MSKTKVVLNNDGFRALLSSPELAEGLGGIAAEIAEAAGEGYASDVYQTPGRVIASAYTETPQAMRHENKHNTLLKVLQA